MASRSKQLAAAKESVLTPVATLEGHTKSGLSISYSPDGKRIISGSRDGTARRWDLEAGKEIENVRDVYGQEVHAVAVSRDGQWVVMGGRYGELRVCEVETGIVRRFAKGHSWISIISCIDISADSTLLASGANDSTVRIWSLDTGTLVAGPLKSVDWVGAVRFSQDSKKIAVESYVGRCLEIWDVKTRSLDVRVGAYRFVTHRTYTPVFWTTRDKTIVAVFGFSDFDSPNTIYEFDASTLETVGTPFKGHTDIIDGLALSFDGAFLASASNDHTIKLWAFESHQLLASFHVQNPYYLVFSPNSRQLAHTAVNSNNVYLCNIPPEILDSIQPAQHVSQRISAPINIPLAHIPDVRDPWRLFNPSDAARPRNRTISWAPIPEELRRTASTASTGGGWSKSWNITPAGTSRIHPADVRSPTDMQRQHYGPGLQSLPQDLLYAHGGPAPDLPGTVTPPVIALSPPPKRPSPTITSRSLHLPRHPRELLPSSSHTDTVLLDRNNESGGSPLEAMLQNLTAYIHKDEDYPAARGGFGEIWKCTYSIDRRLIKVAVKALQVYTADQLGPAKKKKNKRIKRELRICANLEHKNILPLYGYTYGFGPFIAIVSPWAENGNLTTYLECEGAALTLVRRFQILVDIIAGLRYLHANSVIHGDFNSPNVLIHGDGTACVADFGLSLMYSEDISASQASWTSTLKGNVRWMAPELLAPEREDGSPARPSKQSDTYSFGGIVLQVLTNKTPYYYLRTDAAVVWAMQKPETPSRLRYPLLPEKYWEFIEQCWSTDPRDRPSTEAADGVIRNEYHALSSSDS